MENHHRNSGFSHEKWWIFPVRKLLGVHHGGYVYQLSISPDRALSHDNHQLRIVGGIDLFEAMLQQI